MDTRRQGRQTAYRKSEYIQGNTVRKLQALPSEIDERGPRRLSHTIRKNRDKAAHMNPGYVLFLAAAMIITGYFCLQYLQLQAGITNTIKNISALESQFNELKIENDEEYSRITGSIDLERIKKVAMEELGMTYAAEDQIVSYTSKGNDYVRQFKDIQ